MRWYSFSSNKSQLLVSRMTALSQELCRPGRQGRGSAGDAAGKIPVRCEEELPGRGRGLESGRGM